MEYRYTYTQTQDLRVCNLMIKNYFCCFYIFIYFCVLLILNSLCYFFFLCCCCSVYFGKQQTMEKGRKTVCCHLLHVPHYFVTKICSRVVSCVVTELLSFCATVIKAVAHILSALFDFLPLCVVFCVEFQWKWPNIATNSIISAQNTPQMNKI